MTIKDDLDKMSRDCHLDFEFEFRDVPSCISDVADITKKTVDIVGMIAKKDIAWDQIIDDASAIADDVYKATTDCASDLDSEILEFLISPETTCAEDKAAIEAATKDLTK